jgi:hypothetical protein
MFSPRGNESKPAATARSPSPPEPSEEAWEKVSERAMSREWEAAAEARALVGEEEEEEEAFFERDDDDDDDEDDEEGENIKGPLLGERAELLQAL